MPDVIDFDVLPEYERYKLLASLIVPRPIAWITTVSRDGVPNAAPFSMFAMVGEDPPLLMVSINRLHGDDGGDGDGVRGDKDTAANIDATGEFVVHIPDERLVDAMDATGVAHPPGVDELALGGVAWHPGRLVGAPVIDEAAVALECTLWQRIDIPSRRIYLGQVRRLHVRDGLVDRATWRVRLRDFHPVGRFGASFYTRTRDRFVATGHPSATAIDAL